VLTADLIPNDARFSEMWQLRNTGQTVGRRARTSTPPCVGCFGRQPERPHRVIDTGCDYNHPTSLQHLDEPGRDPGNGLDDDRNGFVDDVHGYDFYNNDGDPFDDQGHGTTPPHDRSSGDNGIGTVGVNWNVKIMCIKFLGSGGMGFTSDASRPWTTRSGWRDLTSNSWVARFSQALYDSIAFAGAHEMAFVAAAATAAATRTPRHLPERLRPRQHHRGGRTDKDDNLASFSNTVTRR